MFLNIELFYKKIQNLDRRGKRKREKNIFFIEMKEKKNNEYHQTKNRKKKS